MDRDRILLTPGPLTTTLRTKLAMLKDWGSWDTDFIAVTASVRRRLLDIGLVEGTEVECVGRSPGGDPAAYLIRGAVIAIRDADAAGILVSRG
mgnify:CR=1 FL=1